MQHKGYLAEPLRCARCRWSSCEAVVGVVAAGLGASESASWPARDDEEATLPLSDCDLLWIHTY